MLQVFLLRSAALALACWLALPAHAQTDVAALARYLGADREQRLIEGAKKEGELTLYSSMQLESIAPLQKAVALAPEESLIRILLAQSMLAMPGMKNVDDAISNLRTALARETDSATGYRQLALAYGRKGDAAKAESARQQYLAQAELASAEAYFYEGRLKLAKEQAKRAKAGFVDGTPNWLRADDILAFEVPTTD